MSTPTPPAFENGDKCNGCKKAFGLLKRRHHCRNCGKSFCGDCQTKQQPIPFYGILEAARVCDPCSNMLNSSTPTGAAAAARKAPVSPPASNNTATAAPASGAGGSASANLSTPASRAAAAAAGQSSSSSAASNDAKSQKTDAPAAATASAAAAAPKPVVKRVKNCKCGLPFCICPDDPVEKDEKGASTGSAPQVAAAAKPAAKQNAAAPPAAAASAASSSNSLFMKPKQSGFSGFGQRSTGAWDMNGDLNEQCREAIKCDDLNGVTALLKAGASATYRDRTGATLLHLAAMFDRQEMVAMLVKAGADVNAKNAQGETPIDLAPPSLATKMTAKKFA